MRGRAQSLLIWLLGLLALTACGETAVPIAAPAAGMAQPTVMSTETAVPTLPNPAVVYNANEPVQETSGDMPSFALATATAVEKEPAQAEAKTASETPAPQAADAPTPTPQPTFTPPALPFTSDKDHYWLRRPIPEGGTVWTDKTYPYGSTRGGTLRPHHGVEFYVPTGTPVLAAASGTVIVAGADDAQIHGPHANFYGNLVIIQLDSTLAGQPVYNLYAHLSEIFVNEGQHVDAEQIIAYSGATGVADGSHLHFEVRVGQNSYESTRNPLLWLYPFPEHGTVAGRVTWPSGEPAHEAPVFLRRIDALSKYAATTTYAEGSINPDEAWNENFALDDVVAGYYEVEVRIGEKKYKQEVWVFPYQTSFVEITLE